MQSSGRAAADPTWRAGGATGGRGWSPRTRLPSRFALRQAGVARATLNGSHILGERTHLAGSSEARFSA